MIIDFKVFFKDIKTIEIAVLMTVIAVFAKYFAAVATQKTFRLTKEQGGVIFGLSAAHAAATLAIVMVGYNIITVSYTHLDVYKRQVKLRVMLHDELFSIAKKAIKLKQDTNLVSSNSVRGWMFFFLWTRK